LWAAACATLPGCAGGVPCAGFSVRFAIHLFGLVAVITCTRTAAKDHEFPVPRFVAILKAHAPKTLHWTLQRFPEETHATIFHPAAMDAFRKVWDSPSQPEH
jgi:hypothetical protein